jgi:hypothetical protein
VTARAKGALSTEDIRKHRRRGRHALCQAVRHFRGRRRPDGADLQALGRSIRQYAVDGFGPLGPLAIVVGQGQAHFQAAFFADASPTNRPLRIFRDARQAREWPVGLRRS